MADFSNKIVPAGAPAPGLETANGPAPEASAVTDYRKKQKAFLDNWASIWDGYRHIEKLREFAGRLGASDKEEQKLQAVLTYETLRRHLLRPAALRFPPGYNSGPIHDSVGGKALPSGSALVAVGSPEEQQVSLGINSTEALYSQQIVQLLSSIAGVIEHLYGRTDLITQIFRGTDERPTYHLPRLDIPTEKISTFEDLNLVIPHFRGGVQENISYHVTVVEQDGKEREISDQDKILLWACADAFDDLNFQRMKIEKVCFEHEQDTGLTVRITLGEEVGKKFMEAFKLEYKE